LAGAGRPKAVGPPPRDPRERQARLYGLPIRKAASGGFRDPAIKAALMRREWHSRGAAVAHITCIADFVA
jgi:hypothetical protein